MQIFFPRWRKSRLIIHIGEALQVLIFAKLGQMELQCMHDCLPFWKVFEKGKIEFKLYFLQGQNDLMLFLFLHTFI